MQQIEDKVFYKRYKKLWLKIKDKPITPEILLEIHNFIDDIRGYHYAHHSYSAETSITYLLKQIKEGVIQ